MTLSFLFLLFLIYSFIGWVSEVIYCSTLIEHKFVNRGFLHGPICPVYGFGGFIVVFLLQPFSGNLFVLYVMAVVLTSVLEYITGWALETIFATKWWDYSNERFNLHGRVCLKNSLLFGVMSVFVVRILQPVIADVLNLIPLQIQTILAVSFALMLSTDLFFTLYALVNFEKKLAALTEFMENIKESLDVHEWFNEHDLRASLERIRTRYTEDISETTRLFSERLEALVARPREMTRLLSAFPGMKSRRHNPQLDLFRHFYSVALKKTDKVSVYLKKEYMLESVQLGNRPGYYEQFWFFLIASYIGFVAESVWCVMTTGHLESRTGLIYGMLNPLYGVGGVLLVRFLSPYIKKRPFCVFLGSMAIGTLFEYLCADLQRLLFHSYSWDYTGTPFNLFGRVNAFSALQWGMLGFVWVVILYPSLRIPIRKIRNKFARIFTCLLFILLLGNIGISSCAVYRWAERKEGKPADSFSEFLDETYPDSRLRRVYPNMHFLSVRLSFRYRTVFPDIRNNSASLQTADWHGPAILPKECEPDCPRGNSA